MFVFTQIAKAATIKAAKPTYLRMFSPKRRFSESFSLAFSSSIFSCSLISESFSPTDLKTSAIFFLQSICVHLQ